GQFRVTRIVVPMPGVDRAMLVRRAARFSDDGALVDVSQVPEIGAVDDLKWMRGRRHSKPILPLDEFDLVMDRGEDSFHVTARFRGVSLEIDGAKSRLIATVPGVASDPRCIEFTFAPQHVCEEAIYVTELPGAPPTAPSKYVADDEVCRLKRKNPD